LGFCRFSLSAAPYLHGLGVRWTGGESRHGRTPTVTGNWAGRERRQLCTADFVPAVFGPSWHKHQNSSGARGRTSGIARIQTLAGFFDVEGGRSERPAPAATTGLRGVPLAILLIAIGVLAAAPGLFYYFVVRGGGRSTSTEGSSASNASSI